MSVHLLNQTKISALYAAVFSRAPDKAGLDFWSSQASANPTTVFNTIAAGFSQHPVFKEVYDNLTESAYVNALYTNILGGPGDTAGVTFWTNQLTAGRSKSEVLASFVQSSIETDLSKLTLTAAELAAATIRQQTITNKANVGVQFATLLGTASNLAPTTNPGTLAGLQSDAAYRASVDAIKNVTHVKATADNAISNLAAAVASGNPILYLGSGSSTPTVGQTFTLTTGVNTGAAFTGGAGDDIFIADESAADAMLSTADILTGGQGNDTLEIFTDGTGFALAQLNSIETVNIYDFDGTQSVAGTNFASVTTVNLTRGDGTQVLTVGENVTTIGLSEMEIDAANLGLILDADATAITLNVSDLTGGTGDDVDFTGADLDEVTVGVLTDSTFGALNVAAASSVTINATADLTLVDGVTTTDTDATITVTGAGAVDLSALDTGVLTLNASANTGGITVEIGNADDTVITGSAGNDVITASTDGTVVAADELSVNAGAGTGDVLVITNTTSINTAAEGAKYTNFEIIRTAVDQDVSLVAGINQVQVLANNGITLSGLESQTISVRGNVTTDLTLTLDDASGAADVVNLNLASTTSTTNVSVAGLTVIGVETLNINATTGTAGTNSAVTFFNEDTDDLSRITVTGSADVALTTTNLDAVLTIDATALTGDLTVTGNLTAGSAVNFGAGDDDATVSATLGTTYNMGAGDDIVTAAVATLVADGTDDTVLNGEGGDDTLEISDAAATLTDNHFTFVSNFENLLTSGTGATSITTGAGFNAAFSNGVTITTGALLATVGYTLAAGLYNKDVNVTVDGDLIVGDDAAESISVTTGSGDDTVVIDAAAFVSDVANTGTIVVSTGAGDDDITITVGTLVDDANAAPITITAGRGKDLIDITKVNGDDGANLFSNATFVIAAGDSSTTAYDEITGFDIGAADGADFLLSDTLDFTGLSDVGALATSTDFGSVRSHTITNGVAQFDDAATFTTALVIDADNLADVVGYLSANTDTLDTVAFAFDEDGDGTADATMVFNNNTTDSLVLLVGVTGVTALSGTNGNAANLIHIA